MEQLNHATRSMRSERMDGELALGRCLWSSRRAAVSAYLCPHGMDPLAGVARRSDRFAQARPGATYSISSPTAACAA